MQSLKCFLVKYIERTIVVYEESLNILIKYSHINNHGVILVGWILAMPLCKKVTSEVENELGFKGE